MLGSMILLLAAQTHGFAFTTRTNPVCHKRSDSSRFYRRQEKYNLPSSLDLALFSNPSTNDANNESPQRGSKGGRPVVTKLFQHVAKKISMIHSKRRQQRQSYRSKAILYLERLCDRVKKMVLLATELFPLSDASSQSDTVANTKGESASFDVPVGPRWAIAANTTDVTGKWKPVITSAFKKEYDQYLKDCGQGILFRNLCSNFVGLTREDITQTENGRELRIRGTNPIGSWDRTLISSGANSTSPEYEPVISSFLDPDHEEVHVEAWWEKDGTVHKSWLRDKPRACSGAFESVRYLEDNDTLICESIFHPNGAPKSKGFRSGKVTWRFRRE